MNISKKTQISIHFKDSLFLVFFQLDTIPVLLVPAATEAPVKRRPGATDACVRIGLLGNTVKLVSDKL